MNMLTSNNQYLRPEYLSPLPTTLDAKKSPLALLAQTCSNIGADNPNNKPIIPSIEKQKEGDKSKEKNSSSHEEKPAFKPYESLKKEDISVESDKKTPSSKGSSPAAGQSSPIGAGSCGKASPTMSDSGSTAAKSESGSSSSLTTPAASNVSTSNATCGSHTTLSGLGYGAAASLGLDLARSEQPSLKEGLPSLTNLGLGAYKASLNGLNSLANCTGCSPISGHMPVDVANAFPPGLAGQNSALKAGAYPFGSTLSPYVGYARVKTANGGTTLVPVCRDPYCTNCQLSMQSAQFAQCPSGCTQCTHERLAPSLGTGIPGLNPSLIPGLGGTTPPGVTAMAGLNSQLYPHSMIPKPNVCSWMVGDTYCGKRFTSSEELLQHLRTHTNLSANDASSLALISPSLSLPSGVGGLGAACHLHYSTASSLSTPAGLRRTYPTSLSPVSSLSAASRYHPYKQGLPTLPGAPLPPIPHPGLGMYYSPYGLYGQRLGPPVHP